MTIVLNHTIVPVADKRRGAELLAALLTIASAWYVAGQPKANVPVIGSFEDWCIKIGSILSFAEVGNSLDRAAALTGFAAF